MSKATRKHAHDVDPPDVEAMPVAAPAAHRLLRPPVRSDLPPELDLKEGEEPTEAQRLKVLREAVNFYIRTSLRAPDVRQICEDFIAEIDGATGGEPAPPVQAAVSLSPDVVPVLAAGGTGGIAVTVITPGTWLVEGDPAAPWLTYAPTTPQSTDGTVNWTADVNSTGTTRLGVLHINGEPFTVNQSAA